MSPIKIVLNYLTIKTPTADALGYLRAYKIDPFPFTPTSLFHNQPLST